MKKLKKNNRPITIKEIESVIKNLGPDGFTGEFYQECKELPSQTFPLILRPALLLIPKPDKETTKITGQCL